MTHRDTRRTTDLPSETSKKTKGVYNIDLKEKIIAVVKLELGSSKSQTRRECTTSSLPDAIISYYLHLP